MLLSGRIEMKKLHGISRQHRTSFILWYTGELLFDHFQRFRPAGYDVWEIRRPHYFIDADHVPKLNADGIVEYTPMSMFAQVFAR